MSSKQHPATDFKISEDFTMTQTIESLKVRIHKLEQRDPVINHNIINKLKRKIRALESAKNTGQE
jgi:hypothetical protein